MSNLIPGWKDIIPLAPEVIVLISAFFLILFEPLLKGVSKKLVYYMTLFSLVLAGTGIYIFIKEGFSIDLEIFGGMLVVDSFSIFFKAVFIVAGFLTVLASEKFLEENAAKSREYYPLILISVVGLMLMVSSRNLLTIWIALETAVLPIFVLTGYLKNVKRSSEAAFKYFILASFSSAVYVYGVSLVYGVTGKIDLAAVSAYLGTAGLNPMFLLGVIFIAIGIAFELAAVPFHSWAPDTFEGAPTPITAFLSTAPKAAAFAVFLRIFFEAFGSIADHWIILVAFLSLASMIVGNITAVLQTNLKRMLAYSSIAHAGYILIGIVAAAKTNDEASIVAVMLYILIYTFMNIGAFNLLLVVKKNGKSAEMLDDFYGLASKSQCVALIMLIFMLALTGIPFTSGFIGKLYIFSVAVNQGLFWLAVAAVLNSVISLFYYMRVVTNMYFRDANTEGMSFSRSPGLILSVGISVFFTILIGLYVEPFANWAAFSIIHLTNF